MHLINQRFAIVAAAISGSLAAQSFALAQANSAVVRRISGSGCNGCIVAASRIARLGRAADQEVLTKWPVRVVRNSRGHYFVASPGSDARVFKYDSTGRFLKLIGRRGQGPGEFTGISDIAISAGDSLLVFARGNRLLVFSSEDRFAREVRLELSARSIPSGGFLRDGRIVTSGVTTKASGVGLALHLLSVEGTYLRGVCGPSVLRDGRNQPLLNRVFWLAPDDGVWAIEPGNYRIERCDVTGQTTMILVGQPAWTNIRPVSELDAKAPQPIAMIRTKKIPGGKEADHGISAPLSRDILPVTAFDNIWTDSIGRVWLSARVPDIDWRTSLGPNGERDEYSDALYDTQVEIIDPRTAQVIASTRLPFRTVDALGGNRLAASAESPEGLLVIDIWQLSVRIPQSRSSK